MKTNLIMKKIALGYFIILSAVVLTIFSCQKAVVAEEELIPNSGIRNSGKALKIYTVKLGLDPQKSSSPTCIDIANGLTYTLGNAAAKSTTIDAIVSKGFITDLGFYAPSAYPETKAWSRRKGTQFGNPNGIPVIDKVIWDKIKTNGALDGFTDTQYYDSIYSLGEGSVVPVKTFEAIKALIRVTKIVGTESDPNSYAELEIKVYQ